MTKFLKNLAVVTFAALFLTFAGCAMVDTLFGYKAPAAVDDPNTPEDETNPTQPSSSAWDFILQLLSGVVPWAAGIGGTVRWAYIEARKRKLDGMFKAVVIGIKSAVDAAKGEPLDKAALYGAIKGAADVFTNRDIFDKVVDEIKKAYDEEKAAGKVN